MPKQGHLEQAAQDLVQAGFEYLQRRWRLHNLPGQPVPVLHHPQSEEVLPHVQTELPVPQFLPILLCPERDIRLIADVCKVIIRNNIMYVCMFMSARKKERDYLLVIQWCLLLLTTKHIKVIVVPGDTFLNLCFLKRRYRIYYKEGVTSIINQNQINL